MPLWSWGVGVTDVRTETEFITVTFRHVFLNHFLKSKYVLLLEGKNPKCIWILNYLAIKKFKGYYGHTL